MEHQGQTAQAVLAHGIVSAADGSKMSSSKGNVISLNQDYFGLFTQMMQIPDQQLAHNLAFFPRAGLPFTAEELLSALESGQNPRNLKLKMAQRMVALLWGEPLSVQALERWENEATQQQIPEQIEECPLEPQEGLLSILVRSELAPSNAEAKRLLLQRAVKLNQLVIQDQAHQPQSGDLLQVGKHKFRRLT